MVLFKQMSYAFKLYALFTVTVMNSIIIKRSILQQFVRIKCFVLRIKQQTTAKHYNFDLLLQISPAPTSLLLTGATGSKSHSVNGIFDPTTPLQFADGQIIFVKRNDPDLFVSYCKSIESWCVQPKASKGTSTCFAYMPATQRIDKCKCAYF